MLALATTHGLTILDPAVLKRSTCPTTTPSSSPLHTKPTSSAWAPDNSNIFISSSRTIHRYDVSSNTLSALFSHADEDPISHIVSKDKGTIIYSAGNKIHTLECGSTPKITRSFESHTLPITSLSLSNDATLLASVSSGATYVHNLSLGSHTLLRGAAQICTFHPHSRTRLLTAKGKQLVVFDTTRPSSPLKCFQMSEATPGDILAIACSPFSKSLVAVATSGGILGLVDLDKEKGLFRNINVKVPLTTVTFSPEGGAVYMGTENGKLLVLDLRALDKPPKSIVVSDVGDRVETMAIQKKAATKPGVRSTASPAQTRTARAAPAASPMRKVLPTVRTQPKPEPAKKKVFSPARDPHGNTGSSGDISVQLETLGVKLGPRSPPVIRRSPKSLGVGAVPRRARTASSTSATRKPSTTKPPSTSNDGLKPDSASSRARTASSVSRASSSTSTAARRPSRTGPSVSRPTSSQSQHPPTPSVPPVPALPVSRTPSPDFPDPQVDPITPLPAGKKSMAVLGLGTPEVARWIEAGRGSDEKNSKMGTSGATKGKSVGFELDQGDDDGGHDGRSDEREKTMQVSPRRPQMETSSSWAASPMRHTMPPSPSGGGSAHELLRSIVRDVMCDFQLETKAEITGLHLDLVRMGRGWKQELRTLMDGYVGDLNDLREENQRLRQENDRLKRGY